MFRKFTLIFVSLFILSMSSAGAGVQIIVKGGGIDCGKWLTARNGKYAEFYEGYLLGFVDALQMGRGKKIWDNKGQIVSHEQLFFWTDNYCQKNSIKNMIDAMQDFSKEMNDKIFDD